MVPATNSTLPPRPRTSGNSPSRSRCQSQLRHEGEPALHETTSRHPVTIQKAARPEDFFNEIGRKRTLPQSGGRLRYTNLRDWRLVHPVIPTHRALISVVEQSAHK